MNNYQDQPDFYQMPNSGEYNNQRPPRPNSNIVLPIITLIISLGCTVMACFFCFIGVILSVISIVYATQVDQKYNLGDYRGAESAAKTSKLLLYITCGIIVVAVIAVIAMLLIYGSILFGSGALDNLS